MKSFQQLHLRQNTVSFIVNNPILPKYPSTKQLERVFMWTFYHFLLQRSSGTRDPTAVNFSRSLSLASRSGSHYVFSWLHHMWTQLLVVVGYYGLAAPRLCLAFREEPSLAVTFQLLFFWGKPGIFKRFWFKWTSCRNRHEDHCTEIVCWPSSERWLLAVSSSCPLWSLRTPRW